MSVRFNTGLSQAGYPGYHKDSTKNSVKQVMPERTRMCEDGFDPELLLPLNRASMEVRIKRLSTGRSGCTYIG